MSKRLRSIDVCADCSVADPRWASINRGVLMCDDCGSVHRSLGRHISQVRHLTHTPWPPTLLQMVQMLVANGANSIWEHTLLDPTSVSGKRKASPQDKVHPNKTEFIRAKYSMLAFVHRLPCREDDSVAAKDLSKQLHSSVRTGNLETCLRLLSLGAQANFFHPEKGNTPLHVASKGGQILQAELLAVYGADPGAPDANGKTPSDNARQAGHHELADRLVEIQYELTDRLAFFLCGRKPDHKNGQHFIIPQMAERHLSLDLSELAKAAKKKLQSLSNHLFEELAMDVYDEVDRRETDAVWLTTQNHSTLVTETTVIPFLPVNPEYSSTRNQGRQKLARFNAHEFATLVIDILSDAKRRQLGNPVTSPKDNVELVLKSINDRQGSHDNDQPDYDSVASDEDTDQEPATKANRAKEYMEVKNALSASEAKVQQLMKVNSNLSDELRLMQKKIGRSAFVTSSSSLPSFPSTLSWSRDENTRRASKLEKQNSMPDSDYDNAANNLELDETGSCRKGKPKSIGRHGENPILEADDPDVEPDSTLPSTEDVIRKTEQITKNIQELLRAAQENKHESRQIERESLRKLRHSLGCFSTLVLRADKSSLQPLTLQQQRPDPATCFMPCSERIHVAVAEMAALFPKKPRSEMVRASLNLLTSSAYRLQSECKKALPAEPSPTSDIRLVTQQVIQCAYDIAKAAKQLVTIMTKENN
ncbi:ARF GTPase-activating protein GIT2 isoform X13 [Amblyraja radiata]|uniref:ARF GTPase-activating protein GIT2 isoform X13 n=1 Tax=Amblyraja radiata TaxID=386614 RepID=UPI0014029EEF|nr:ARF GTPase-activating protein GIT2 isoform X13 [Amblyraja radiata]